MSEIQNPDSSFQKPEALATPVSGIPAPESSEILTVLNELQRQNNELELQNIVLRNDLANSRQREGRYKSIVESQSEFVERYLPGGIITYANEALVKFTGVTMADLLGKSFYPFIYEDDREETIKHIQSISVNTPTIETECRVLFEVGRVCWTRWSQTGVFDSSGTLIEYQAVGKDITEQKNTELALRESERKYRLLFESAEDSISVMDMHGKLLAVNPMACKMLGYAHDELMSLPAFQIDARPEEMLANISTLLNSGYYFGETEFFRKDGSTVPISVHARLIEWSGAPAIMNICRDITDRKRIENELLKSEERFRAIMALCPDIISVIGQDGALVYNSPAAETIHGYTTEDLIGVNTFDLIHQDDQTHVSNSFNHLINNPDEQTIVQYRYKNKDGTYIWMECCARNEFSNPLVNGVIAVSRNISDRIKQEEARLEFERNLLQSQKLESLGIMAGGIAHDFNNLLQVITGNMDMVEVLTIPDSETHKLVMSATKAAEKATHLTSLMLAYVGKGVTQKEVLDLNQLARENGDIFQSAATASVSMEITLAADLPTIVADGAQLQQLIMNLITNASEAIVNRLGIININTGYRHFDQAYLSNSLIAEKLDPGSYVFLEVSDNGCGMSSETLKRLFDPFFTTKFTGRGLGMSAVMGIIKTHGGGLFVDTELEKGTTFTVLFPVAVVPALHSSGTEPHRSALKIRHNTSTVTPGVVLVVDDEKNVLKTCSKMVQLCGFTVITACDGFDAVAKFQEHSDTIQITLMDLTMPHMGGVDAMNEIYKIKPDAKVIISSGFNESEIGTLFVDRQPSGFIRKPYSLNTLKMELLRFL